MIRKVYDKPRGVLPRATGLPDMELKLGKLPAKNDTRTIRMSRYLLVDPPESFDVDASLSIPIYDNNMYLNDTYGDCVIAGRAHMTLRFEGYEQYGLINIIDQEVKTEYFKETGGKDSGLVMLSSLNAWRNGWVAAANIYNIDMYGLLTSTTNLKQAVYLLRGAYIGIMVYETDMEQFKAGQPWEITSNSGDLLGGHCIYIVAYNATGPICVTWGKRQQMSWRFYQARCDEAFGIVDDRYKFSPSDLDVAGMEAELKQITKIIKKKCWFFDLLHERRVAKA